MPLDLTELSRQVREMSNALHHDAPDHTRRRAQALERYLHESSSYATWARAVDLSRDGCAWLLARPVELLNTVRDAPPRPPDYAVIATDGSHIDIDRHGAALCYVLNIGRVYLRYGAHPAATLSSRPMLCFREEDLYLRDGMRRIPIEGNYLSARRDVAEGVELVALAEEFLTADDIPALALQDGTLVRWTLAGAEKAVLEHFLRPYLNYLDAMRAQKIPVASYISRPRSPEVAGMIRLMLCPDVDTEKQRGAKCSTCSDVAAGRTPSCFVCQGLSDADILADMLEEGQRGPLFASMSRVNVESYGEHQIHFFYMRVGREVARVEMPRWVAEDPPFLDRVHAVVYDQCLKGQGYPVALARAHEQAVIHAADRRAFERVVERSLIQSGLPAASSRKATAKEQKAL
ncbi:DNA double-strand break repair nuclease NurA [Roseiflexus sp.]|uniref:DNA double-strand break repair nuclease NurA n=1 Tax=Roseiflexus sp. TaxID=2562120 RepID=UPI00398A8DB9